MARVQQNKSNSKKPNNKAPQKEVAKKQDLAKQSPKREPSKNEILFFRLGLSIVVLTIITVAIIFTIQFFMNENEEVGPFDDYQHLTGSDLQNLTFNDGFGSYGDFTYFSDLEDYEEMYEAIMSNAYIYIYFYKSSELNTEVEELIKSLDLDGKAFFFIDLDLYGEAIFANQTIAHLNLDQARTHMLLTFDVDGDNPQTFRVDYVTSQIKITLNNLK
ncbi:MAG: hypothetical protein CVV61_05770 [Tenericutes bacterium HGW-Tenericutes-6]|jgi:hypothetical protein|nr:MAG: hypothetical protein CVV61_05770 [Tenericutes bacterium HGW-Tenericutes-6]